MISKYAKLKVNKLIIIISLFLAHLSHADTIVDNDKYDACFITAQRYYQVPKEILKAIAYVESHYNPNAYNKNNNGTFDIGLMQINSSWLPKLSTLNINEQMLYNPCQNIYMGAWVLANNIKLYGLNWTAIQRYNGHDINLRYATKIYNRIKQTYPALLLNTSTKQQQTTTQITNNTLSQYNQDTVQNNNKNTPTIISKDYQNTTLNNPQNIPNTKLKHNSNSLINNNQEISNTNQKYTQEVNQILFKNKEKNYINLSQKINKNTPQIITKSNQLSETNLIQTTPKNNTNLIKNNTTIALKNHNILDKDYTQITPKNKQILNKKSSQVNQNLNQNNTTNDIKTNQHLVIKNQTINQKPNNKQHMQTNPKHIRNAPNMLVI